MKYITCMIISSIALCTAADAGATAFLSLMDNEGHYDSTQAAQDSLTLNESNDSGAFLDSPWSVALSTGTDNTGVLGVPSISMDVTSTAERAGVLYSVFSIDDLSFGSAPHVVTLDSSIVSILGAAGVDWQVCVDDGNILGAQTQCTGFQPASLGALTFAPTVNDSFSLTIATRFNAFGPASFDVRTQATDPPSVPEPATVALLGLGLLAIAFARRSGQR
jgi:hypothetical protein